MKYYNHTLQTNPWYHEEDKVMQRGPGRVFRDTGILSKNFKGYGIFCKYLKGYMILGSILGVWGYYAF